MDAAAILSIPISSPFRLFPRNNVKREELFRGLAKQWHPDRGGDAGVLAHINALHDAAKKAVDDSDVIWETKDGKYFRFEAKKIAPFELGTMYISDHYVAFAIDKSHSDLERQGLRRLGGIHYPDEKMRTEHERFIPVVARVLDIGTSDVVLFKKTEDVFLLRDLLEYCGGTIDPRHVAWMITRLLNVCCFYEINKLCHNGLSLDTVFVSPRFHTAFPIGGWWYSTKRGESLKSLPPDTHAVAPYSVIASKISDHRIDLESVRGIARACLGTDMSKIPQALRDFVRLPAPKSPITDYMAWPKIREDSFGPRKYVKWEVQSIGIYP